MSRYSPVAIIATVLVVAACTRSLEVGERDGSDPGVGFGNSADSGSTDVAVGLTEYCPSNKCPSGYTTCLTSRFPCDVNLLTDRNNCGECGFACPPGTGREWYECVDGRCLMVCKTGNLKTLDRDGSPDNGCETDARSNDSCGGCGITCTDPAKPCLDPRTRGGDFGCGCRGDKMLCSGDCVDPRSDNRNCSTCGNKCPPDGGPALDPALHMYYGCVEGECGKLRCESNWGFAEWADCDNNRDNGCESSLFTGQNCGACGNACPAGQECRFNVSSGRPQCMCPEGKTFCATGAAPDIVWGKCVDTASDSYNCGGCSIYCQTLGEDNNQYNNNSLCVNGVCKMACAMGKADCNGDFTDGCEITIDSDPRNCGDCGIVCDAIAGQACAGGRCVVEPCDQVGPEAGVEAK